MAARSTILDLRQLLAERFPQPHLNAQARLATGLPNFDTATEGGLAKSAITELTSPHPSAGSALLIHRLLHAAATDGYFMALIDGRDSFDPGGFADENAVALRHLLWVRCQHATQAVKAADLLLRDGNFPLVVLDLILNQADELRKIPQTHWYRLQRLVEATPTALLALTRRSTISSAQWKLSLENVWHLRDLDGPDTGAARLKIEARRVQGARQEMAGAG